MNIAERYLARYESKDFKEDYAALLLQDRQRCIEALRRMAKWYGDYPSQYELTDAHASAMLDAVIEDRQVYTIPMHNAYVGHGCVDSVHFGEQEECLDDIRNHTTGQPFTARYLRKVFNDAGYSIVTRDHGTYAYYDLSYEGLRVCLNDVEFAALYYKTKPDNGTLQD